MPPGRALEMEVVDLLRGGGFEPQRDAHAAKPRQTDIYARGESCDLLIEVKDRKRPIDVADIDSLRARLLRTASDIVGVLITTSPVTKGAVSLIESERAREVLIVSRSELNMLRRGEAQFAGLIARKRRELRANGRVWFKANSSGEYMNVALPESTIEFVSGDERAGYFCARADFVHAVLAMSLPDTGWGIAGGEGVRLELTPSINTAHELRDLFGLLHKTFGLGSNGSFAIHQAGVSWHGCGVLRLLGAIADMRARYRAAPVSSFHHTEEIVYFDEILNGSVAFHAMQRISEGAQKPYLHGVRLTLQLPGIPVELSRIRELCRYIRSQEAQFEILHDRRTQVCRLRRPLKLEVIGTAVQTYPGREAHRWIVGVLVKNPFFKKRRLPVALTLDGGALQELRGMEVLLCDSGHHIEEGDEVDYFYLQGLDTTDVGNARIIRPVATWHKLLRRLEDERHRV